MSQSLRNCASQLWWTHGRQAGQVKQSLTFQGAWEWDFLFFFFFFSAVRVQNLAVWVSGWVALPHNMFHACWVQGRQNEKKAQREAKSNSGRWKTGWKSNKEFSQSRAEMCFALEFSTLLNIFRGIIPASVAKWLWITEASWFSGSGFLAKAWLDPVPSSGGKFGSFYRLWVTH